MVLQYYSECEGMATTVQVDDDTWEALNRMRNPGQTFDDVIREQVAGEDRQIKTSAVVTPEGRFDDATEDVDSQPVPDQILSSPSYLECGECETYYDDNPEWGHCPRCGTELQAADLSI